MDSRLFSTLISLLLPLVVIGIVVLFGIIRKNKMEEPQLPPIGGVFPEPTFTNPIDPNQTADFSPLKPKNKRSKVPIYLIIAFYIVFRFVISIYT